MFTHYEGMYEQCITLTNFLPLFDVGCAKLYTYPETADLTYMNLEENEPWKQNKR